MIVWLSIDWMRWDSGRSCDGRKTWFWCKLQCKEDSNGIGSPNMHRCAEIGIFMNYEGFLTPSLHFQLCDHCVLNDSSIQASVLVLCLSIPPYGLKILTMVSWELPEDTSTCTILYLTTSSVPTLFYQWKTILERMEESVILKAVRRVITCS